MRTRGVLLPDFLNGRGELLNFVREFVLNLFFSLLGAGGRGYLHAGQQQQYQ
ncbi:hypothetical protein ACNKHK_09265 [Shigella flexneri]